MCFVHVVLVHTNRAKGLAVIHAKHSTEIVMCETFLGRVDPVDFRMDRDGTLDLLPEKFI